MAKISILVPVFNAENYLEECLNSLKNQTFPDWECVIVDDGSTDRSLQLATEFANLDQRFKVFSLEHSGNLRKVRNFARSQSAYDWLLALDADDYLASDCLEKLVNRQKETNADVVLLQLNLFDNETAKSIQTIPDAGFDFSQIISGPEAMMLTVGKWEIANNGLFQKKLYTSQETYSNEIVNIEEYAQRIVLLNAKTVAFSNACYFYRQHRESITKKNPNVFFSTIRTDRLVEKLVVSHFGKKSKEARKAKISLKRKVILLLPTKVASWIVHIYARYKRP